MRVLTSAFGRLPARRFRFGSDDESAGYVRDFVGNCRSRRWLARDGFDYWAALPSLRRPVLSLVGAGDRHLSPPDEARAVAERVPGCEFHVVGRGTGLPFDPDHMALVLDERARPAWDAVAQFIRRLATAPAPR
jgi:pimeloyl-ACP methyl ester carboxylesterase